MHAPVNPYKKNGALSPQNNIEMGIQSQKRISMTQRTNRMKSPTKKRRNIQPTLTGEVAFDSIKDCVICRARHQIKMGITVRVPKRQHDKRCPLNSTTKGKGVLHSHTVACIEEGKRLEKLFNAPLDESEKCRITTQGELNAFFVPKPTTTNMPTTMTTTQKRAARPMAEDFARAVESKASDAEFQRRHSRSGAPLAIMALADYVCEHII